MKIKKIISYLFWYVIASIFVIWFSNAEVIGISQSEWSSKPDSYWFSQSCDENIWNEVYSWKYGLYLDNFENPSANPWPLYIWNYKLLIRWDYLLYNNSDAGTAGNWLIVFNRDYLQSINRKVNPWQTVRHLTTAEEVNWATFWWQGWSFDEPYVANGWAPYNVVFHVPNYRSDWTHPSTPTAIWWNWYWDVEFRTITLYDSDNNLNTTSNNRAIVECQKNVIRRCWDGILNTTYEQCDPNLASSIPSGYTCNVSCQLVQNTPNPQCNSTYSGTHYTNTIAYPNWLNQNMNLCAQWTVTNFTNRWNWYGHAWHYSWTCSNSAGSINCTANQNWCWDWIRSTSNGEQCDPNDPNQNNWWVGWCNSDCTKNNTPPTPNPQCNSTYSGTHYTNTIAYPNWLNQNMNLCTQWTVTNFTNRWNWYGHAWHYSWTCSNSAGSINCTANQNWCGDGIRSTSNGEQCDPNDPNQNNWWVGWCNSDCTKNNTPPAPQPYCWDWILQSNEQCDPGSGNFWNGCNSNCQLMTPTCTLTVNPNQWTIPLNTTINWTKPNWAKYLNLTFGDGQSQSNPIFTLNHTYNTVWTFNLTLTVQNNYNGQVNWTKPTATCSANVTTTQPGSPVPYLLKQQKTWGMANFTSNQINVEIWETITYKVNFGNSWTVAATWEVRDILPPCVNYLTSSIHLPNGVTYNWPITWAYWSQTMVKYKNFRLQPGQGWYMLINAQVRWTWMNWLTSCQNVYSYLNTWYFKFLSWNTLSSQVIAIRPQAPQLPHLTINKELITAWDMTAWSTVVYKITLTNDWNATYHNAYILDVLPNAIQYQTSSIQNVTNYLFEEGTTWIYYYFKYYNFNLNAGQSAIVYLTWVLKQWFNFNQTTNCAATSGAVDCEEFPLAPIPYIQKYQKIWNDSNPNSNWWTTHTLNVQLWQYISYRIDFGNSWNKAATGEVKDILPQCVQYISANLVWANWVWPTYYPNTHTVRFKNIPLAAWQRAHMMVVWKIKQEDGCQNIYSYLNTWSFHFIWKTWENSTVLAERPNLTDVEITKTVDKNKVKPWDTVIYTITYKNNWPEILQSYTIVDYWPNDQLVFNRVLEPTTPTPTREWENIVKWHFDTPLGVNETRIIKIEWTVR